MKGAVKDQGVLKGTWVTYLIVCFVTLGSVFPLYYTIVMASHTNAEMAAARRRCCRTCRCSTTSRRRSSWHRSTWAWSTR
jgi:ABC-type glycerol-3-phosphate transport system permease component